MTKIKIPNWKKNKNMMRMKTYIEEKVSLTTEIFPVSISNNDRTKTQWNNNNYTDSHSKFAWMILKNHRNKLLNEKEQKEYIEHVFSSAFLCVFIVCLFCYKRTWMSKRSKYVTDRKFAIDFFLFTLQLNI